MDGREFLLIAQGLVAGVAEAAWRSAVSRAYYAAFHVARESLEALGSSVPRGEQAHAFLWLRLCNCGDPQIQNAGRKLNGLRGQRNRADYTLNVPFSRLTSLGQVQIAERIIEALDEAALEPTRTAITEAMKIYERDVLREVTWQP